MKHRLVIGLALSFSIAASAQTYSLAADWSNSANPNGPWAMLGGGLPLPSTPNWIAAGFPFTQPAWAQTGSGVGHIPAWMKIAAPQGALDIGAGDVMVHTWDPLNGGSFGDAEVAWTCPANGYVDLSGSTWITRDIVRSNDWFLRHNGIDLRSGTVSSGDPYSSANPFDLAAGAGSQPILARPIAAGDVISFFIVRTPGFFFGDFCAVRLTIALYPDLGSCAGGSFPGGASLLTIDGSIGLIPRAIGQPFTIGFGQPAGVPFAAPFAIFGHFGVPGPGDAYTLPFGIGTMCFTPAVLFPLDPVLFTLADSFGSTGILPATPAPWAFPVGGGVPFPLLVTLQGATYSGPTTLGVTNSIVLDVN